MINAEYDDIGRCAECDRRSMVSPCIVCREREKAYPALNPNDVVAYLRDLSMILGRAKDGAGWLDGYHMQRAASAIEHRMNAS